ncbi:MAG: hypothetical protein A3D53_00190 [Candidatus Magasanikbacteria bacterium RIFCSPHIGHO2_02_FULL_45_10]|uniref:SbsA Ig-like domain-containing protein n=1 Tax=Candidatus Magasanikbacteria bacterium RIFCSPHIGHO2_02_FULL_45_10 TaxID=1798679 RepID=A0A1F6MA41_9BACT|nr:MAG: hypothetical protein A3D53_00190 [Candidatus Magasanikbacteria bacterium RIFCSPHIGHO2_02_FULL_45_10]
MVFCLYFLIQASAASAETAVTSTVTQGLEIIQEPLGQTAVDIRVIVARVIRVALGLLGIIFLILILYGGYLWMTAGGNAEQIAAAKKVLTNGTIGLIIILSAYSIVLLIMNILGLGSSGDGSGDLMGEVGLSSDQNFYGSGALGTIIKDHYPDRNQIDVPRNAKIIITFKKPVNLASFIDNTNGSKDGDGNDILGDCTTPNPNDNFSWENNCDRLKIAEPNKLPPISIKRAGEEIGGASVLASGANGSYHTVVIRPLDLLGSESENMLHTVRVGAAIKFDDPENDNPSIFKGLPPGRDFYEWKFTTNNTLDLNPPYVVSVFPANGTVESKNSVIQVDFNEPIDPTGIQGVFTDQKDYFAIEGNVIFATTSQSTLPPGEFRLLNGYKTLEFTSTLACGTNACGGTIYCLPVCDKTGADCTEDTYEILLRAGRTFTNSSFEALPFSGLMDLSGNALDANRNKIVDQVSITSPVFPNQKEYDNFFWSFRLNDRVDMTAPYLHQVSPGPNAGNITPDQELSLLFSKRMRVEPMYSIAIEEKPISADPLCFVPRVTFNDDGTTDDDYTTKTELKHCPFITTAQRYYYPVVTSSVEDVKFNCFYPGKGPIDTESASKNSKICDDAHPNNCCGVDKTTDEVFCCNGVKNTIDTQACIEALKSASPLTVISPLTAQTAG